MEGRGAHAVFAQRMTGLLSEGFSMTARSGLISSLILNCALLIAIVYFAQNDRFSGGAAASSSMRSAVNHGSPSSPESGKYTWDVQKLRAVYASLVGAGLEEAQARSTLVAYMYASSMHPPEEYWKPRQIRLAKKLVAEHDLNVAVYAALRELFGQEDGTTSSMQNEFLSLQQEFAFLTSDKQLRVQEILLADKTPLSKPGTLLQSREAMAQRRALLLDRLRAVLTQDEFFEYQLRRSPIAERLRETGFEFTEEEFRKIVVVLLDSSESANSQSAVPMTASWSGPAMPIEAVSIAKVLGEERFRQYVKVQDPAYQMLQSTSMAFGLEPTTADSAYQIIQRAAEKANGLGANKAVLSVATRREVEKVMQTRDRELQQLLGEQAFHVARTGIATHELAPNRPTRPSGAPVVNKAFQ